MSIVDKMDELRKLASEYTAAPPHRTWQRVQHKLDSDIISHRHRRQRQKNFCYSIAASVAIFASLNYIFAECKKDTQIHQGQIAEWETLESTDQEFYLIANIHSLNKAYTKLSSGLLERTPR